MTKNVGALWESKDSSKATVAYGMYKGQAIVIFKNLNKKKDNQPDYIICDSKAKEDKAEVPF
jgi:hypothetical protein